MLHLFSGKHDRPDGMEAMFKRKGVPCYAFDTVNGMHENVLEKGNRARLIGKIHSRTVRVGVMGTPCKTCSIATFQPDGPGPFRTRKHILGLPNLSATRKAELDLNNELISLTCEVSLELHESGGAFIIENPVDRGDAVGPSRRFYNPLVFTRCDEHGPLWLHPEIIALQEATGALFILFDQCQLDGDYMKSTCLLVSPVLYPALKRLWRCRCKCKEPHEEVAIGKDAAGNWRSAFAAAYPEAMNEIIVDTACKFLLGTLGTVQQAALVAEERAVECAQAAEEANAGAEEDAKARAVADLSGALDAEQLEAAQAPATGALALVAPAGSGKTHTVHMRVRHLIEVCGVLPPLVLCLTFSKDAGLELRRRLCRSIKLRGVVVQTFHSWALGLLRVSCCRVKQRKRSPAIAWRSPAKPSIWQHSASPAHGHYRPWRAHIY